MLSWILLGFVAVLVALRGIYLCVTWLSRILPYPIYTMYISRDFDCFQGAKVQKNIHICKYFSYLQ